MKTTFAAVVALASTVSATGWTDFPSFKCPANTNNKCSTQQSGGFNWGGLDIGSFTDFDQFKFNGWSCASSFGSGSTKRDILTGRTFQPKCITGQAQPDKEQSPSFGCGSSKDIDAFSVTEFEISVEFDCDLEFHYQMGDGSTCKHKSSCSKGGSVVKNSQCGGAKSVTVVYPSQTSAPAQTRGSCSIGVHSIGFDCSSASSTVYQTTKTKTTAKQTTPATLPATTTAPPAKTTPATSAPPPAETTPATTSQAITTTSLPLPLSYKTSTEAVKPTESSTPVESTATSPPAAYMTSTVFTTFVSTIISCAETVTDCPAHSTVLTTLTAAVSTTIYPVTAGTTPVASSPAVSTPAASTTSSAAGVHSTPVPAPSEVITTVVIETSTTICPVTLTHTTGDTTHIETTSSTSTVLLTNTRTTTLAASTSPVITTPAPTTLIPTTIPTSTVAAVTQAPCPSVLPSCLNTWLFTLGCSSNTDTDCFCPDTTFVANVFSCLSAHGASTTEIYDAQKYFQGICASYIPSNPAIVTGASSIPHPSATSSAAGVVSTPVTTVSVFTTLVVPCTETSGPSAGSIIPSSSTTITINTAITIPQVVFQTISPSGTSTAAAALVVGTAPASAAAGYTTAAPAKTTFSAVTTGRSNGTATGTAKPAQFSGAAGKDGAAFGGIAGALAFAVLLL